MEIKFIKCKDLKKKTDYWLTYDYYGHGGKKVQLKRHEPASLESHGTRGKAAIVKDEFGNLFWIHPKASLFSECPQQHQSSSP